MINMSWKEFLKLDWRKVLIFVIISMLSILLIEPQRGCCSCCPKWATICIAMCCPCYNFIVWPYFGVKGTMDIFGIFVSVVYWYLISCLIVWVYDKVKKR